MRAALSIVMGTLVVLAGCSSAKESLPPQADSTAPVLAPGRPGEVARTLSPSEAATAAPTPTANAADVKFMQDMIVHHRQAIDMSALAPTRAAAEKLKGLAARIKAAQGPEIQYMTTWLKELGQKVPEHHAAHEGMAGMATPEELGSLKSATGPAFDRLFLQLMIKHHMGAIKMAETVLRNGSHVRIEELAGDVSITQTAEIRRMQQMQKELA
ncbi:DUF305 domain-containing protein [Nonomuraea longicatena]|uniref:DUF305 domain-containing protein n=1 Tax=Nonomuraea longicatena TaxID=83682 RepID=A0ABN1PGM1_9ACTN